MTHAQGGGPRLQRLERGQRGIASRPPPLGAPSSPGPVEHVCCFQPATARPYGGRGTDPCCTILGHGTLF